MMGNTVAGGLDVKLCAAPKSLSGGFPRDFPHKDLGAAHNLKSKPLMASVALGVPKTMTHTFTEEQNDFVMKFIN